MIKKILAVFTLFLTMILNPVFADQGKSSQEIGGLSIVDFQKETLSIPYVFVKNLAPEFNGQCFAVEMMQNDSVNTWKIENAELVECPPEAAALVDSPDDPSTDGPDDSNSNDDEVEDDDSVADDSIKDDSIEDDSKEDDSIEDSSRDDESEDDELEDDESTAN